MSRIVEIATSVPPFVLDQGVAEATARRVFAGPDVPFERLAPTYGHSGVARRHVAVPPGWFAGGHDWHDRHVMFDASVVDLAADAAERCLARAEIAPDQVDAIVTVCSTGITTPTIDARLLDVLPFRRDVERLPIFGLGCAGGVLGLARAAAMAGPGRRVLLVAVELCSLTFRRDDRRTTNVIATALFGDGAAAVLIDGSDGPGRIVATGEHTWPATLGVMGWTVEADGLGVVFSREIPDLVRERLRPAADQFLARNAIPLDGIDHLVCHPGGPKVLDAIACAFDRPPEHFAVERSILREYGNMSSPTIWFVADGKRGAGMSGRALLTALGPGFTAGFAVVDW